MELKKNINFKETKKKTKECFLAIDPSGTGTTGICLIKKTDKEQEFFFLLF